MVWDFQGRHSQYRAGQIVYKHTKSTEIRDAVNRALDLVETLMKKRFSSPTELRAYFVSGSDPLFSHGMAEKVFKKLYSQHGGAQGLVGDLVENSANGLVSLVFGEKPVESTLHNIVFFLNGIEKNGIPFLPFIPISLISSSIEIFVEFLLNAATDVEVLEPWIGLFPIPEAGAAGGVVGEVIKAVLAFLAAAIALSRQDFETAFEAFLLSIPIAGIMLNRAYRSEEKISSKYKDAITNTINNIPGVKDLVSNSSPTPLPPAATTTTGGMTRRKRVKHMRSHKNKQRRHRWTRRQ
uniref:Uncharacterized protein n=1 Tax=viral metagenome TaxID=1070528 RepID=A0A6C0AIU9_9ZZZZ